MKSAWDTEVRERERERERGLPRYKFHPSSSGSLMTFFKVASRSSTKLVTIESDWFQFELKLFQTKGNKLVKPESVRQKNILL
jgi:hypothetical protein